MAHDDSHHDACLAMFEQLSAYVDNELDAATCRDLEKHMAGCTACKSCLETLRQTVALCREMKSENPPEVFSAQLKEVIRQLTRSSS
jgi:anti-sigma factor RsiW